MLFHKDLSHPKIIVKPLYICKFTKLIKKSRFPVLRESSQGKVSFQSLQAFPYKFI